MCHHPKGSQESLELEFWNYATLGLYGDVNWQLGDYGCLLNYKNLEL